MKREYELYSGRLLIHTGEMREVLKTIQALTDFYEGEVRFEIVPASVYTPVAEKWKRDKQQRLHENKPM